MKHLLIIVVFILADSTFLFSQDSNDLYKLEQKASNCQFSPSVCASQYYQDLDNLLNTTYKKGLSLRAISDQLKYREAQREWLKYRDAQFQKILSNFLQENQMRENEMREVERVEVLGQKSEVVKKRVLYLLSTF